MNICVKYSCRIFHDQYKKIYNIYMSQPITEGKEVSGQHYILLPDFLTITSSVGLPLTTISVVDPAQQAKLDSNIDTLRICDHMPDPNILYGNEATKLLGALVRYFMQNLLLKTQWQYPMVACESDFNLGRTKFERVVSGKKRGGGHEYGKKRTAFP